MPTESDIKSANANNRTSTVWTIVLGFAADSLMRWSWPDARRYLQSMPQFINACGGRAFEHGTAYVTGGIRAAALWLPPGVQQDEEALDEIMAQFLSPGITEDMVHLRRGMAPLTPILRTAIKRNSETLKRWPSALASARKPCCGGC